jgi:hypothetical protein
LLVNHPISKKENNKSPELKIIKQRMRSAYNNGYRFHQTEVKNDPQLLKWVLKENYWDYQLPVDLETYDKIDKVKKSY